MNTYNFNSIKEINNQGIVFSDGLKISFSDCIEGFYNHYNTFTNRSTCVAERKIDDKPPFFQFYTGNEVVKIIFECHGLFAKNRSIKSFISFQKNIIKLGYKTFDLS